MAGSEEYERDQYGLGQIRSVAAIPVPDLPFLPKNPQNYRPGIGLIGCGNITEHHLRAYDAAGYRVLALCDLDRDRAEEHQRLYYPQARVGTDHREVLADPDVEVVDIATPPGGRASLIEEALETNKHVLSQKPFADDLDVAERLVAHAEQAGRKLAVNQNGRWSPHWSFAREAIAAGLLGEVLAADFAVYWNHEWVVGTPFDDVEHLLLYDFGIHWFDIACSFFHPRRATEVVTRLRQVPGQQSKQALAARCVVDFEGGGQASFAFHGAGKAHALDSTVVTGTRASVHSIGPDLQRQALYLQTEQGRARPRWQEAWFPDGFHGTMAELLCAIEEDREPRNSARQNLHSLELCFAACASSLDGRPRVPGEVRQLPR